MEFSAIEPFRYGPDDIVISEKEYLRYLGIRRKDGVPPELTGMIGECLSAVRSEMKIRGVVRTCPVDVRSSVIDLGFCRIESRSLAVNLAGCRGAAIFAVTVGAGVDRLISRLSATSPSCALAADAVASAAAEGAACRINADIARKFGATRPRFSPGFGDLPLSFQRDVISFLDAERRAGITLTDSLMLVPVKSTTAIVGVPEEKS